MHDERINSLTKRHDEALVRLAIQESAAKKNRNYLIGAILTALISGSGGATALLTDDGDKVKDVVAAHVALTDEWRPNTDDDIEELQTQQIKIREALVKLQTILEERASDSVGHHEIESLLGSMGSIRRSRKAPSKPKPERVRQYRKSLFGSD